MDTVDGQEMVNASSTLQLKDEELKMLKSVLSNGETISFEKLFQKSGSDTKIA
jgi:hypothetical protein